MDKFVAFLACIIIILTGVLIATNIPPNLIPGMTEKLKEAIPAKEAVQKEVPAEKVVEPVKPVEEKAPAKTEAEVKEETPKEEAKADSTGKNCIDSDGKDYYAVGYVTFYKSRYDDRCISSAKIYERYCDDNDMIRAVIDTCPNGCENGACRSKELPAIELVCFDSDNGLDYNVYGYVEFNGNVYKDGCSGSFVKENYCEDNKPYTKNYECPYGCDSGACKEQGAIATEEKKCTDSDNGLNIYTFGYVTYNNIKYDDKCNGDFSVFERYCEDDKLATRDYKCPGYCEKGVCMKEAKCSDAIKDEGEECDGFDFGGKTCVDYGYNGGSLLCDVNCKLKFSACT